ncbi:MAG TPA: hypothetical protein VK919_04785 [Solirubrobacterales bacterium]|nr:hypothetical protein [Solirubrobacterales bacterium]
MRRLRPRLTYANAMATIAVFVVLGGGAYATHTHKIGTADLKNGAVKTKKMANGAVKTKKIGANAVKVGKLHNPLRPRWAVVHHNGNLERGRGAVDSGKVGVSTFVYSVEFNRNVSQCSYAVTLTEITGGDQIGVAHASPDGGNANAVLVVTRDTDGVGDPRSFSLQVAC